MNLPKNMLSFFPLLWLIFFALFTLCSKENAVGPSGENYRYPLSPGNTWTYERSIVLTFDVSSGNRPPDSTLSTITVDVVALEVIFDSLETIKVRERRATQQGSLTTFNYYQNTSDALYLIAGLGVPTTLPKQSIDSPAVLSPLLTFLNNPLYAVQSAADVAAPDSLYLEQPAKIVLKYPLAQGIEWKYSEKNKPRRANKRVLGEIDVQTAAGTFTAVQVHWIVDFDGDGSFDNNILFFDYIANAGLIKRSFLIQGLPVVDNNGTYIGRYNYHDLSTLTSYKLN